MADPLPMNQPEQIVRTLDLNLITTTRLILYGRSALALGFPDPQPSFCATMSGFQLECLLASARVPPIPEIQDAYDQNSVWLRRILAENPASP